MLSFVIETLTDTGRNKGHDERNQNVLEHIGVSAQHERTGTGKRLY